MNEWSKNVVDSIAEISATTPTFNSFIGSGSKHCVLGDDFYTAAVSGKTVVDFVNAMMNDAPAQTISCGDDCGSPAAQ